MPGGERAEPAIAALLETLARSDPSRNGIVMPDAVDLAEVVNADDVLVRDLTCKEQFTFEAPFDVLRRIGIGRDLGRMTLTATETPNSASNAW